MPKAPPQIHAIEKEITFYSGNFLLKGVLHLPDVDRPPVVVGSHGLFSDSNSPKQIELARKCNDHGIAFFRFDHRGCGQSQGNFDHVTSLEGRCVDLVSAVETVQSRLNIGDKLGLFGSSMGGAVCISVANVIQLDALVTVAAPVRGSSVIEALEKSNNSDSLSRPLIRHYLRSNISEKLSGLHHILIFHGEDDRVVPVANAREIYAKAAHPKKLVIQKNGDHRMSKKEHQENFIAEAANWYKNCFDEA